MEKLNEDQQALINTYTSELAGLSFNDGNKIELLTTIARENVKIAKHIVRAIEYRIVSVDAQRRLFAIYLVDSILRKTQKSVGRVYADLFSENLYAWMISTYRLMSAELQGKLSRLLNIWKNEERTPENSVFNDRFIRKITTLIGVVSSKNAQAPVAPQGAQTAVQSAPSTQAQAVPQPPQVHAPLQPTAASQPPSAQVAQPGATYVAPYGAPSPYGAAMPQPQVMPGHPMVLSHNMHIPGMGPYGAQMPYPGAYPPQPHMFPAPVMYPAVAVPPAHAGQPVHAPPQGGAQGGPQTPASAAPKNPMDLLKEIQGNAAVMALLQKQMPQAKPAGGGAGGGAGVVVREAAHASAHRGIGGNGTDPSRVKHEESPGVGSRGSLLSSKDDAGDVESGASVGFTKEYLSTRHDRVIDRIYFEQTHQCIQTGKRFMENAALQRHLDILYQRKKMSGENEQSRKWYIRADQWTQSLQTLGEGDAAGEGEEGDAGAFGGSGGAGGEGGEGGGGGGAAAPAAAMAHSVRADPAVKKCPLSGEKFDVFYNEEADEWHFRDALRLEGPYQNLSAGTIVSVRSLPPDMLAGIEGTDAVQPPANKRQRV